ncbi:MAG: hypothetical protein JRJ78_15350 [Deltaproteobacteria bacterium]|nr:hypothetical protein [Deltaproteobacteria bacterium]
MFLLRYLVVVFVVQRLVRSDPQATVEYAVSPDAVILYVVHLQKLERLLLALLWNV